MTLAVIFGGWLVLGSLLALAWGWWLQRQERLDAQAERRFRRAMLRAMCEGAGGPPLRVVRGGRR